MTRDEFELVALRRLQKLYPQARFLKAGQLEIAIVRTPSGRRTPHRLRLARAWAAFCQNGERFDLDGYLTRVIGTIEHRLPPEWEAARGMVFPRLIAEAHLPEKDPPLFYPVAGPLGYVLGCEEYDVALKTEHLENWNIPEECVLAAAMENLGRLWQAATIVAWTVQDEVRAFHVEVAHGEKAAFLLLPEFYQRGCELLDATELLVAVPNRKFLVAFGAEDDEFREVLRPIVKKERASGLPLSAALVALDESGFAISRVVMD